jgi:hypothetical protein
VKLVSPSSAGGSVLKLNCSKVQVEAMQDMVKSYDESSRKELATKGDIQDVRAEIQNTKHDILKWMMGLFIAQAALVIAVIAFLR